MIDALLGILAIIAIIAIGAFIIVVLSDLLISIIDGKNGIFFKRSNAKKEKEDELPARPKMVKHAIEEEKPQEVEPVAQIAYQSNVDMEEAEKEEKLANKQDEFDFSSYEEDIVMPPKKQAKQENYDSYIDEITALTEEMLADEDNEEVIEEIQEEVEEEVVPAVSNEELERIKAELEEQRKAYEALLNEKNQAEERNKALETEKEQLVSEKDMLAKALEEQAQGAEEQVMPTESLEALTARLEMLEERLRTNEKLLKANKKEFQPLFRIKKSLDNDTKKLRRKEASVAKQKVMLYGVNNFVDIDEEKAKQLNEELDLLEGLRLSVKHCEDVMNANKDRYPVLEQTNKILTSTVADIKADIEEVQTKIEAIKAQEAKEEAEVKEETVVEETPAETPSTTETPAE